MASRRTKEENTPRTLRPAATTPEGRENQLIGLAVDLAEQQLADGSASAQVITHYLKLGSSREKLEKERIAMEVELMQAKKDNMVSAARVEELYETAIAAMRSYAGHPTPEADDYDEDPDLY